MARDRFRLPAAVHVFLIADQRILLLRRSNTGYEDGKLSVVAGHLDGDEQVTAAAARETREEIGIRILPEDFTVVGVMHRKSNDERVDFFVTASRWAGQIVNAEPHKCNELVWAPLDQLPDDVIPYVRRAIENYQRGTWFDSFGWSEG